MTQSWPDTVMCWESSPLKWIRHRRYLMITVCMLCCVIDSYLCVYMQVYQQLCRSPPLGQNMPPLSGKILWARQLLRHIEEIMDLLKVKKPLLQTNQGKAVVRKYNKMALVLTEYEILHYQSWLKIISVCHKNIQVTSTVLIGEEETLTLCCTYIHCRLHYS